MDEIVDFAHRYKRPNTVDAEWIARPPEIAWRKNPDLDELLATLHRADAEIARYALWLALSALPDSELPTVADAVARMRDVDARLLSVFLLLGRAAAAPSWWITAARAALPAIGARTSRKFNAVQGVVRRAITDPGRFEPQAGLSAGAKLFNAGKFFEAHEVWEDVWAPMRGPERDFFRGLINLAVAMNKAKEGNPNGAIRLLDRADRLLRPYAPEHRGVDLAHLRARLAQLGTQSKAWKLGTRAGIDPKAIPKLPES